MEELKGLSQPRAIFFTDPPERQDTEQLQLTPRLSAHDAAKRDHAYPGLE